MTQCITNPSFKVSLTEKQDNHSSLSEALDKAIIFLCIFSLFVLNILTDISFYVNTKNSGISIKINKVFPYNPYLMFAADCIIFCSTTKNAVRNRNIYRIIVIIILKVILFKLHLEIKSVTQTLRVV